MSQESRRIEVEEGVAYITIHQCDSCGKKATSLEKDNWIDTRSFFQYRDYLTQNRKTGGYEIPVEWETEACSIECFRPLMADAMNRFCELWEAHHVRS